MPQLTLAIEELGKHVLAWSAFWKAFRGHHPKYRLGYSWIATDGGPDDLEVRRTLHEVVEKQQRQRLQSLYVDFVDGHVKSPQDIEIDREWVKHTVEVMSAHVRFSFDLMKKIRSAEGEAHS